MEAFLDALPSLCLFRRFTGLLCPGCGMTHALIALLEFDVAKAYRANALSPFFFGGLLLWGIVRLTRPQLARHAFNRPVLIAIFAIALTYGIGRNL